MALTASPDQRCARDPHAPAYADRRNGRLPGAQRPKGVRAVAEHRWGPVYLHHGKSMSKPTMNRPAANVDHGVAAPATTPLQPGSKRILRVPRASRRQFVVPNYPASQIR